MARNFERNVTKFALHLIAGGKLTFDERVVPPPSVVVRIKTHISPVWSEGLGANRALRVHGAGVGVLGLWGLEFRVWGSGSLGFGVQGLEFRVSWTQDSWVGVQRLLGAGTRGWGSLLRAPRDEREARAWNKRKRFNNSNLKAKAKIWS